MPEVLFEKIAGCTEGRYALFNSRAARGQPDLATFRQVAKEFRDRGCNGVEVVAPTLADDPTAMSKATRKEFREVAEDSGVQITGLHWALAKQEGVYLTDPNPAVQNRTADYLGRLSELIADLGGEYIVHGSPAQRNLLPDVSQAEAFDAALAVYRMVMPKAADNGIMMYMEQLSRHEGDFWTTMAEVERFLQAVDHDNCQSLFDAKAFFGMCGEEEGKEEDVVQILKKYQHRIGHVHLNDWRTMGGPGCEESAVDFRPILQALVDIGYLQPWSKTGKKRWLSIEVFDFASRDLLDTIEKSVKYIRRCEAAITV